MMPELNFFEVFVELFNINASLMIIILCALLNNNVALP